MPCQYATAPITPTTSSTLDTMQKGPTTEPSPALGDAAPPFKLHLSDDRRRELMGAAPGAPNTSPLMSHAVRLVVQVLKAWLRLMAARDDGRLPPMVHRLQVVGGLPATLARCAFLACMWMDHDTHSADLVRETILQEVERLLGGVCSVFSVEAVQGLMFILRNAPRARLKLLPQHSLFSSC